MPANPIVDARILELYEFLPCVTPVEWVEAALDDLPLLINDHANCEKKAAASALSLMFRYPQHRALVEQMSRLAREELQHFEQVERLMQEQRFEHQHVSASRYAKGLRECARVVEPERLADLLICGAFIEARSAERFALLIPHLETELRHFYSRLLTSEIRHYHNYLHLAQSFCLPERFAERVAELSTVEAQLVSAPDEQMRFHSGPPRRTAL